MPLLREHDRSGLKRPGRYFAECLRIVVMIAYQQILESRVVRVDAGTAGCSATLKSTSGGVAMLGEYCIKTWSANRQVIAPLSGEAEHYDIVEGLSAALGMTGMLRDMSISVNIVGCSDSDAAKGIASRRGLRRVRHIEPSELWFQD